MRPVIKLSQAWLDRHGWSLAEAAAFLEIDSADAVPASPGDLCPQCARPPADYDGWRFEPDPATATSEHEHGRAYVRCICGTMYWYAAVDVLNEPNSEARVRAASVTRTPGTGSLQVEGQVVPPVVVEEITATDVVAVAITEPEEPQPPLPSTPPSPEPLPPGGNNTLDTANQVVQITNEHRRRFHAATSFIAPPFGPLRAREPLP